MDSLNEPIDRSSNLADSLQVNSSFSGSRHVIWCHNFMWKCSMNSGSKSELIKLMNGFMIELVTIVLVSFVLGLVSS